MSRFSIFNKISDVFKSKRYVALLSNSLPVDQQNWGSADFLRAYEISLYFNRAVTKRAEGLAEIEFGLKTKRDNVIKNDPSLDVLYKPNNVFTGRQFWALWCKYLDLVGETYILVERNRDLFDTAGKVTGLHLLRPDLVKPVYDKANPGTVLEYIYKTKEKDVHYPAGNIIPYNIPDPANPLCGRSLAKAGVRAIQTDEQISTYHSRILQNGGKIEGVFKFKANLNKEQLHDARESYEKQYGGAKRAGLPLFLGGDADYTKLGLTPQELSFMEAKKMTLEDICIMTGVPKSMLGSYDDIQYANAETGRRAFYRDTIKPIMTALTTVLDERLFPDDRLLTFTDPTPENIEEKLKETESGVKNYYMTTNEARARHGLDPVKNGDEILVPFNLVSLGEPAPSAGAKKKAMEGHPNTDPDVREMWAKMQVKRMDAREKIFVGTLNSYWKDQEDRLITRLSPTETRVYRKQNLFDESMSLELEVKIGKESFLPVLTELLKDAGIDAMEFAGSTYPFSLSTDIASWLDKKTEVFLKRINETTFEELKQQFAESFEQSESRDKLIKRVRETYKNATKARAAMIARTEVHAATQYGTIEGYKQSGLQIKVWVAVNDTRTRDSHASLDGEERPINTPFSNGLMYPGDTNGPAEEVINCRCVI